MTDDIRGDWLALVMMKREGIRVWLVVIGALCSVGVGAMTPAEEAMLAGLEKRSRAGPDAVVSEIQQRLEGTGDSREMTEQLWFRLADAYVQRGAFAEADEAASQALATFGEEMAPLLRAEFLGIRAALPWRQGDLPRALDFVLQAYRLAKQEAERVESAATLARCANRLGVLYSNLGRPDEALSYYQEALRLNRGAGAAPLQIASILGNIGLLYHSLENMPEAARYQNEAVELYREADDPFGLARNTVNLAITRGQLGETEEALDLIGRAIAVQKELGDTRGLGSALLGKAGILNEMDRPAASLEAVKAALEQLEADGAESEIVDARIIATRALSQLGRIDEALEMGQAAAELAEKVGIVFAQATIQHLLAELHEARGDPTAALVAERAAAAAQSELLDTRRRELVTVLEVEFAAAERERALAVLRARNAEQALGLQHERYLRRNLVIGVGVATFGSLLLFYGYRVKVRYSRRLERSNAELAALSAEKSALMDLAAHDLRGPLTTVRWQAEATLRQGGRASAQAVHQALTAIAATAGTMHAKVSRLLDSQRAESGEPLGPPQPVVLERWLSERVATFSAAAERKSIRLDFVVPMPLTVTTHPDELAIILDNLVDNALKFSPPETVVTVAAELDEGGDAVVLSVTDQGPGIAEAEQDHLFTKYRRLSARPTAGETSSGLGLAMVKQWSDRLGIGVRVAGVEDQGARFELRLPWNEPGESP